MTTMTKKMKAPHLGDKMTRTRGGRLGGLGGTLGLENAEVDCARGCCGAVDGCDHRVWQRGARGHNLSRLHWRLTAAEEPWQLTGQVA
jgi:hypothetical protein